jgi:carboxylate-amine ligase
VAGGTPGAARAAGGITLGVEEEFVLLDPRTGAAALAGPDVARMRDGEPGIRPEVMRFQVETVTRVCTSLDDLAGELTRLRQLAADACLLAATGIAPYRAPGWPP